jgi:hypothetical protein
MRAFDNALHLTASASSERADLARVLLDTREGVVVLDAFVALRPENGGITCEVIVPSHSCNGNEQRYKELIVEAQALVRASPLAGFLAAKPLRWLVVDDYGMGTVQLWPVV